MKEYQTLYWLLMASFVQYIIMAGSYWRVFPVAHALLQIDNSNAKIVKQ